MGKPLEKFWKKGTWQFLVWVRTPAGGTMEFDSHEDGNAKQGSAMELALRLVIAVGCASNERAASAKDALQKSRHYGRSPIVSREILTESACRACYDMESVGPLVKLCLSFDEDC